MSANAAESVIIANRPLSQNSDGTNFQYVDFCSSATDTVGLSLALDPAAAHTNYQQAGKVYDLFVGSNSGTTVLGTGPAWSSNTSRGTGAGTTQLGPYNGVQTNANSMTLRYGNASGNTFTCAVNECTYVGSFYSPSSNSTTLAATVTGGTTSFSLAATLTGPGDSEQYYALVQSTTGSEEVLVTAGFGSAALTVTRAQRGTSAQTFGTAATITMDNAQTAMQFLPASTTGGSDNLIGLSNAYNQVQTCSMEREKTASWTYSSASWRAINGSQGNSINALFGLPGSGIQVSGNATLGNNTQGDSSYRGLSLDGALPVIYTGPNAPTGSTGNNITPLPLSATFGPQLGLHYVVDQEYVAAGTAQNYANSGNQWINLCVGE